jgi:hypothetical protein
LAAVLPGPRNSSKLKGFPLSLKDFRVSLGVFVSALAVLLLGGALIGLSWWLRPINEAEQAMLAGDQKRALELYESAHQRFDRLPITKSAMPGIFALVTANELSLLYSLQRYDDIIEKSSAEAAGEMGAFWAGCAMFDKALLEQRSEARMGWISQSHQQFRRALDQTAGDWDTKFNFELTGKLIGGLKKQPQTANQDMMKILRDSPKQPAQPARKVG